MAKRQKASPELVEDLLTTKTMGTDHFQSPHRQRQDLGVSRNQLPRQTSDIGYISQVHAHVPENVGILQVELYIPSTYVDQEDLERSDGVKTGKYTLGLCQKRMAFVGECEDIYSICLTVVQNLLEKHQINPRDIGHLEVGTETTHDKSKSVKSVLMNLFEACGNLNIEGVDCKNACYGGTAALFNAVQWVQGDDWDGRFAIVVAADIAVYEKGPARPTGGAGAVAMLIGPDATIVLEPGSRFTYSAHSYDFFKPTLGSEYPTVDGPLSVLCYLHALEACYIGLGRKVEQRLGKPFTLDYFPYCLFHSPYIKLVRKAYARLLWSDYRYDKYFYLTTDNDRRHPDCVADSLKEKLSAFSVISEEESFTDKDLETLLRDVSEDGYRKQVGPGSLISSEIGNMYCGSLYGSLLSLLHNAKASELHGAHVAMFSYGSGLCSTMFLLHIRDGAGARELVRHVDVDVWLNRRQCKSPEVFTEALVKREIAYSAADEGRVHRPSDMLDTIMAGTYHIERIDELGRRYYRRKDADPDDGSQTGAREVEELPVPVCGVS